MNFGLILTLVALLLILIIGYNIMLQYQIKAETSRKQESQRYILTIDATEELIGNAHHIPFSQELLICLHTRILDALKNMHDLDPKNKQLAQRIGQIELQISQIKENFTNSDSNNFKVPSNDRQAILMLKLVKRLRDTIRNEHNKGRFDTQSYVVESQRLETIQVRINIENVIKRAKDSIARGQVGTAIQLLKKGLDVLNSKNDNYSKQAREKLQLTLTELESKRQAKSAQELQSIEEKNRDDDMEALFGEKKKW
ncbi:DNA repair protein [Vibrio sp. 10N.286.49.B3]|uniref:DNA repair protein n=1 Tax=Vibrio sp. 10N.286.49.B3 TaxID=1880855 RepID=UPI000C85ECB3|nr:DNA repair protein [Vibrio sp. 10N.286.49.B3]PMH46780.1 DNA repair protein [Vibrio sp. 10N.286.49.B3]